MADILAVPFDVLAFIPLPAGHWAWLFLQHFVAPGLQAASRFLREHYDLQEPSDLRTTVAETQPPQQPASKIADVLAIAQLVVLLLLFCFLIQLSYRLGNGAISNAVRLSREGLRRSAPGSWENPSPSEALSHETPPSTPAQHAYHAETLTLRVVSRNASIALVHCARSVHGNALNAWMMLDGVRHVISFT